MKDIKSVMIGFLLATCLFLFMGNATNSLQTNVDEKYGARGTVKWNPIYVRVVD